MAEHSAIEWTDATWNPWRGCTKVSAGCANCYMFREQIHYGRDPSVVVRSQTTFADPLKWKSPRVVFTCSWSDWFHEAADPWRDEAWDIIRRTPQHTYLVLTKRTGRIARHLPWAAFGDPWPNVWLGTSIENQETAFRARQLKIIRHHRRAGPQQQRREVGGGAGGGAAGGRPLSCVYSDSPSLASTFRWYLRMPSHSLTKVGPPCSKTCDRNAVPMSRV